jgi:hypothetical protein
MMVKAKFYPNDCVVFVIANVVCWLWRDGRGQEEP